MGDLAVLWHDRCLDHESPPGEFEAPWTGRLAVREAHPDRPARLRNVRALLRETLPERLDWLEAPAAGADQLRRIHDGEYLAELRAFSERGGGRLTPETGGNGATWDAARRAAGGAVAAVEHALDGGPAYALVRPSGHHAGAASAGGFCVLNNAAVAAAHALATERAERVAVVDWDVHHGDGTQAVFADRSDALVVGLHAPFNAAGRGDRRDLTGGREEVGTGEGRGYTVNVPLPPGTGDAGYAEAVERVVSPVVAAYDPDLLVVSAGQDPGTVDPLGRNVVTKAGFEDLGRRVRRLADRHADGRLALVQEGGYQVSHLAYATLGVVEGVLGVETGVEDPFEWVDGAREGASAAVDAAVAAHADHWPV